MKSPEKFITEKKALVIFTVAAVLIMVVLTMLTPPQAQSVSAEMIQTDGIFVPIIMYHSVCESKDMFGDYVIPPETLENDIIYLKENGYQTISVGDLISFVHCGGELPPKPVILTFDDGHYNNLLYVLPLLEKYDMKATISIVGSYSEAADEEILKSPRYSYLSAKDISELFTSGRIEIANHSYDLHSLKKRRGAEILVGESFEEYRSVLLSDLRQVQDYLADNCRIAPQIFTYPYGIVSEPSLRIVKSAGFQASLGVEEKPNYITADPECLYCLNRYNRPYGISTGDFMAIALKG